MADLKSGEEEGMMDHDAPGVSSFGRLDLKPHKRVLSARRTDSRLEWMEDGAGLALVAVGMRSRRLQAVYWKAHRSPGLHTP